MKVSVSQPKSFAIPFSIEDGSLKIAVDGDLHNPELVTISSKYKHLESLPNSILIGNESKISRRKVYPFESDSDNLKSVSELSEYLSNEDLVTISYLFDKILDSESKVMDGQVHRYQNITIFLHSLGSSNYRIEWHSRMTGSSCSLARIGPAKWTVIRKWASSRNMNDVSQVFDNKKQALYHFLANTDVVKTPDDLVEEAKSKCIDLFLELEGEKRVVRKNIPKLRLQGAIGKIVEIRDKISRDRVIAKGTLMQLIGKDAEIKVTERIELQSRKDFIKVPMMRVWLS